MNVTLRQFAVSGSAAVAVLGGAATLPVIAAQPASAAASEIVVEGAVTAPVTLPDGRTIRITGMGGYGHQASAEQISVVAGFKADTQPGSVDGITNGLTPDSGTGSQLVNPQQQVPAGTQQQYQTQASGGTIAVGIVSILLLAIIVLVKVKHSGLKAIDATLGVLFGLALAGTFIGDMGQQMTNSIVGSLGNMLGGLG